MLVVLCGTGDHAMKANRSLINLIMKLKADYPKVQEYLHISKYDSLVSTSHMRLTAFTLLTPIGTVTRYLARVKHPTRSGTCHLFFETYHFCR
jgi:hypothetical protein